MYLLVPLFSKDMETKQTFCYPLWGNYKQKGQAYYFTHIQKQ